MKKYLIISFLFVLSGKIFAQLNCVENLQTADKNYRLGKFEDAVKLLENCINSGFTREEKIVASRLASLCYYRLNNLEKADKYARILLKLNPQYQNFPMDDPRDFARFLGSYRIDLKWQAGIRAGLSFSNPVILKQYTVTDQTNTYNMGTQYSAGAQVTWQFRHSFYLRLEPGYCRLQYKRSVNDVLGVDLNYSEIQNYFDLPAHVLWGKNFGKTWWYAGLGSTCSVLGSAHGLLESRDEGTGNRMLNSYGVKNSRKSVIFSGDLGGGFEFNAGAGRIGFSVFYSNYFGNFMIPEKRYDDLMLVFSTRYIENDFKINTLKAQVYFQIPLSYKAVNK